MTDRRCANCFHGLDGYGRLEIQADDDLEQAKADEHPYRIHLGNGDIADEERDERTEVPEGPGKLSQVVFISAQPHGFSLRLLQEPRTTDKDDIKEDEGATSPPRHAFRQHEAC